MSWAEMLKAVNNNLSKPLNALIGKTDDTGGSEIAGSVMAKLNAMLRKTDAIASDTRAIRSRQYEFFDSDGTFTVPEDVTTIYVTAIGAGGGGGGGKGGTNSGVTKAGDGGGGGNSGNACLRKKFAVTSGSKIAITIGKGGRGGSAGVAYGAAAGDGDAGGSTVVGSLITCAGGTAGTGGVNISSVQGVDGALYFDGVVGMPTDTAIIKLSDRIFIGASESITKSGSCGGHGGNGLLFDFGETFMNRATSGINSTYKGGTGGSGYGAGGGGGSGGYVATNGGAGGAGLDGAVLIEW